MLKSATMMYTILLLILLIILFFIDNPNHLQEISKKIGNEIKVKTPEKFKDLTPFSSLDKIPKKIRFLKNEILQGKIKLPEARQFDPSVDFNPELGKQQLGYIY